MGMSIRAAVKRSLAVAILLGMGLAVAFLAAPKAACADQYVYRTLKYWDSDGPGQLTITPGSSNSITVDLYQRGYHFYGRGYMWRVQTNVDEVDFIIYDGYGHRFEFWGEIYNFFYPGYTWGAGAYGPAGSGYAWDGWEVSG